MVSPSDKNGGDVLLVSSRTQAAADGRAVIFASLAGFGDVHGGSLASEYMAVRTAAPGTNGWTTHGISPKQPSLTFLGALFGRDPHYEGQMSSDLSRGVFRAYRPLTDAPNVANIQNFYVREDLRIPGEGKYQLISDAPIPVDPGPFVRFGLTVKPVVAAASSDFSVVAFESTLNLVPEASGPDVKLYESIDGRLKLAGVLPDGTPAPSSQAGRSAYSQHFTPGLVSDDGSRVFFQAPAGDAGGIYMRVDGERTVEIHPSDGRLWTASKDGLRVFFSATEGLMVYEVDAPPGNQLSLVSAAPASGVATVLGISDDGHYVYFVDDTQARGLYVWHDGTVRLIGNFAVAEDVIHTGLDSRWAFLEFTSDARVTPDGHQLLFMTRSDAGFTGHGGFTGYNHGSRCTFDDLGGLPCRELYVYNEETGQLRCASCNSSGAPATAEAFANMVAGSASNTGPTSHLSHALSDDGRWVFFSTREALVPEDINGRFDAYEYDNTSGAARLISTGRGSLDAYFLDASASGRDVFFATRDRLVGWDVDANYDVYDARVGGGLPEPASAPPSCSGESCQGSLGAAPAVGGATSAGFRGRGDLGRKLKKRHHAKHRKTCRRGAKRVVRRGKVRCVRRRAGSSVTGGFPFPTGGAR